MSAVFQSRLIKLVVLGGLSFGVFLGIWWVDRFRETPPDQYHIKGKFGPQFGWPIIPIHVVLLPDGRLLSYGTDERGRQGAQFQYDVWDPKRGLGPDSHLTLPNKVGTDLFCSGQLIVPADDSVLLVGGDRTVNGVRNWSSPDINFFDGKTNVLRSAGRTMERPRWYPTVTTMPNGEIVVTAGRLDPEHYAPLPEIYNPKTGWRTLPGAEDVAAFGVHNWDYPRQFVQPNGKVFVMSVEGHAYEFDTSGEGSVRPLNVSIFRGHPYLPSVMYLPGKILTLRWLGLTYDLDINGKEPVVKSAAWSGLARFNGSMTVMADGTVLLNGGSMLNNASKWYLAPNYESKIWHPDTGKWTDAAIAKRMRLYHSISLLMQDGSILTGGGGATGPETNLNGEIYYPPYLFKKDGSGERAVQPVLQEAPDFLDWGQFFKIKVDTPNISKIHLIKTGSVTHTNNFEERFIPLNFKALGEGRFSVEAPANANIAPPGYYHLFVLNSDGVPSYSKLIKFGG